eukprot:g17682.t1
MQSFADIVARSVMRCPLAPLGWGQHKGEHGWRMALRFLGWYRQLLCKVCSWPNLSQAMPHNLRCQALMLWTQTVMV